MITQKQPRIIIPEIAFACQHCGQILKRDELLRPLEKIFIYAEIPPDIISGYRCPVHNQSREVGGKPDGAHEHGLAVDFHFRSGREAYNLISIALGQGCLRIFFYKSKPSTIHMDWDATKPNPLIEVLA